MNCTYRLNKRQIRQIPHIALVVVCIHFDSFKLVFINLQLESCAVKEKVFLICENRNKSNEIWTSSSALFRGWIVDLLINDQIAKSKIIANLCPVKSALCFQIVWSLLHFILKVFISDFLFEERITSSE